MEVIANDGESTAGEAIECLQLHVPIFFFSVFLNTPFQQLSSLICTFLAAGGCFYKNDKLGSSSDDHNVKTVLYVSDPSPNTLFVYCGSGLRKNKRNLMID